MKRLLKKLTNPQASIAELLYKKNAELTELNKVLTLLRELDETILGKSLTVEAVSEELCSRMVQQGGFAMSGILVKGSSGGSGGIDVTVVMRGGWQQDSTIDTIRSIDFDARLLLTALTKASETTTPLDEHCMPDWVVKKLHALHASKSVVMKLTTVDSDSFMFFSLSSDQGGVLNHFQSKLVDGLQRSASLLVDNALLSAELHSASNSLKRSNEKLKALDQAKDEFISMASHQLRTPLTSIKGYISMILEGDAGDVPEQQKDMLNTAFTSAQRMVYLIADLLNVSRLQTGKFIIESVDCYLPDVVSEELAQLKEAAAAKQITLIYDKPKEFPVMKLDETKIRQVIMNFTDNALYYTPAGGEVHIELHDKPKSIEFKVVDNGMGVPKPEQHKLFAKFYRAGNARKARPDGTGLGLFMAKKVVVGSGGAILFKSKEGKGSTFGFTFPKK